MSNSTLAAILIPVVVAGALVIWIAMVFHANRHPRTPAPREAPGSEVTGGTFQGAGRQLMPRRDATPREATGVPNGGGSRGNGDEDHPDS
jgi:hypothetical protein